MTDTDIVEQKAGKRAAMAWNDAQIDLLKTMWEQGHPASEIALAIGENTSRNAVIGKAHRMGLSGRASPIKNKHAHGATLLVLNERMCRWPIGDPRKPGFHFCGSPIDVSATYCATHRAIAFSQPKKPTVVTK